MSKQILAVLGVVVLLWSGGYFAPNEKLHPDGILIPAEPLQDGRVKVRPWEKGEFLISPLASYTITARVLSRENYWLGEEAKLSPTDLALGWGPASDNRLLSKIKISQGGRFYYWHTRDPDVDIGAIVSHSANVHIIPGNDSVAAALKRIGKGDLLTMKGYLIEATREDGFTWTSSLSRTDTGNGACEVFWVESLREL